MRRILLTEEVLLIVDINKITDDSIVGCVCPRGRKGYFNRNRICYGDNNQENWRLTTFGVTLEHDTITGSVSLQSAVRGFLKIYPGAKAYEFKTTKKLLTWMAGE